MAWRADRFQRLGDGGSVQVAQAGVGPRWAGRTGIFGWGWGIFYAIFCFFLSFFSIFDGDVNVFFFFFSGLNGMKWRFQRESLVCIKNSMALHEERGDPDGKKVRI